MNNYLMLLKEIKDRIRRAQVRATMSANTEMLLMYWDVGRIIDEQRSIEGWGTKVIQRLSQDIRNDLPELKGFSERNIARILAFYREYSTLPILPTALARLEEADSSSILPTPLAELAELSVEAQIEKLLFRLPWAHNVALLNVKDTTARVWYMVQTLEHGWSHDWLADQIKHKTYERQENAVTNFVTHLPAPQSALAQESLKDPYIFDFLTLAEPFHERELETGLVAHVQKFLLELGAGFSFMGRQYHLTVSEQDFYIDLLFYHTKLRCYVVIELKKGKFKPEYAGYGKVDVMERAA